MDQSKCQTCRWWQNDECADEAMSKTRWTDENMRVTFCFRWCGLEAA